MNRLRSLHPRWRLEVAIVLVPLLVLVTLQYVSNRRLARAELIAHQTTLMRYMDAVAADVRRVYESAADELLSVPGDALAAERFDAIARHFDQADTSTASLLFVGLLDGCVCLTRYYGPETGYMGIGADHATELVALRVGTLLRLQRMQHLHGSDVYVDEQDVENRVLYRFVTDSDSKAVGFVGLVIDSRRFEREYLPHAMTSAQSMLSAAVRDNLIVRVTDGGGRVVAANRNEPGQADAVTARFDLVFREMEVSARSRHTAAAQLLESSALMSWFVSILMSVMAIGGVLLTWRAARRERRLSRIRNGFVANVSHELRTPLASIAVFGELLRRGHVTGADRVVQYGRRIEEECMRLRHLVDSVLSFSRIESAQVSYRPEAAAIEDVVEAAVAAVDNRRAQGGFTIAVTSPNVRLPEVRIDAEAMTRVFVNLLDNAMKYSGRCRLVRVDMQNRGHDVAVCVADAGIGIALSEQTLIFDEFYRAARGNAGVRGTGLGLAIARHAVQAHGGRIEVDSRPNCGAMFVVLLPVAEAVADGRVDVPSSLDHPQIEARA